ncbi:MAG TPA: exodeoxyribonuclease VII small subunit [Candidatus Brocadiia bacterium]|nr:exodeoxyribonuclease VII small subunit [Candidatus Brocadiia bacterium]
MAGKQKEQEPVKKQPEGRQSFEDALKKLEDVVRELEGGDLSLDDALARCESGMEACKLCYKLLEEAEVRVKKLIESDDGGIREEPFAETEGEDF